MIVCLYFILQGWGGRPRDGEERKTEAEGRKEKGMGESKFRKTKARRYHVSEAREMAMSQRTREELLLKLNSLTVRDQIM